MRDDELRAWPIVLDAAGRACDLEIMGQEALRPLASSLAPSDAEAFIRNPALRTAFF